jgi:hypothetical protein
MLLNWLPYKYIIRRLARSHGLLDPMKLFSQFSKFAQPSEVAVPVELLRAGIIFHARGLLNTRTIQNNLDWLWPYWVERQFNPLDPAFIPRSLSISHVNISNRNWTAVGLPDCTAYPIVDPRGLVTPFYDGWSLEGWLLTPSGKRLLPPKCDEAEQRLRFDEERLTVETVLEQDGLQLRSLVDVVLRNGNPMCRVRYLVSPDEKTSLIVALRPFNPEGVSFIEEIALDKDGLAWSINGIECLSFGRSVERHPGSTYEEGDVFLHLLEREDRSHVRCDVGLASAAAVYSAEPGVTTEFPVQVDLSMDPETKTVFPWKAGGSRWCDAVGAACGLRVPDERVQYLYDAAVRSMVLHAPREIYPGPFYYKRFWFRDAVFILQAMLCIGLHERAERIMDHFPSHQKMGGYFRSQEGEWDSNGQVLWIMKRFFELTGRTCKETWMRSLVKGGDWIRRKRLPAGSKDLHAGLLPAGFSAEHLGNNDYYYWDDLWSIAGLEAAAELCRSHGLDREAGRFRREAGDLSAAVENSLSRSQHIRRFDGLPASPYRRMDSGAVGSVIGGYPLQLWPPAEPKLLNTVEFLLENCFMDNAFFQDMSHSGLNIYLSLHCAQVLLRTGDDRFFPIVQRAAELASPTGQWPEAIHPQTLAGCMGDGQHIWAAAEWVMMLRNMFVREEGEGLVLLQGLPREWMEPSGTVEMGPVHTPFGPVTVRAGLEEDVLRVHWEADWRHPPPEMTICPFGTETRETDPPERGEISFSIDPDR